MKKVNFVYLTLLIVLTAAASLSAAISYSPPAPRTGETVTFTLSPSGAPMGAISWNFGDGTPVQSGSLTITHAYAAVGSYTASASYITLNSAIPKVDQATVTVTNPRQITFSPPQPKTGQAVAFTAQNFFSACIRWDFGDATIKNDAAAESHAYANAGSYTVRAYDECGGSYGAETMVTVAKTEEEPPPTPTPTPTAPSFAVSIVSLYFAGGKADVSVAKDAAGLQAFADIQVTGTGILQWQWLVDGMAVKADTLAASFSSKYSLDSGKVPGLPTAIPGRHLVTLRFQNPKTDFTIPVISYFIGLRGPAPVVRNVTPQTLAPGVEYTLELEGAELTPGTEISFPAPLALVKKPVILSPTTAQATVFVPITAGNGVKAITAKNEYGQSDGPGQVLIAAAKQALPPKPGPNPPPIVPASLDWFKEMLKNTPSVQGFIDCYPPSQAWVWIDVKKGGMPISGAVVKVNSKVIPESDNSAGSYISYIKADISPGHMFNVSLTIGNITYSGSGGKIDTTALITQPANGSTIYFKNYPQFDCKWTFNKTPAEFFVNAMYREGAINESIFSQTLTADHVSIPTAGIPSAQGELQVWLVKGYGDITLEGLPLTSKVQVFQTGLNPQKYYPLSAGSPWAKPPMNAANKAVPGSPPPKPGPTPPLIGTASLDWFKEQLKKTPTITGSIDCYPYFYGSPASSASIYIDVKKGGAPVSGAIVKVDGIVIPKNNYTPGQYSAETQLALQPGHVFTVTVQIDGTTYTGSGGKIDTIVHLTQPADGSTIYYKNSPQFDCKWTFSNGPAQVHLYALYIGQPSNKGIFEQDLTADHVSIPTAPIPGAQGALYFFLGRKYADIKFDGLLALTSGVQVYQNFGQPQSVAGLSDSTLQKPPLQKMTGTTPAQATAALPVNASFGTLLKTTPQLNGSITYNLNPDPDSTLAAYTTFFFYQENNPIPDAVIKVDGITVPPNPNNQAPEYGCYGCYKKEGPWPTSIAIGHVTTISITTNGNTYTGSGGLIDSFPQLVVPAEGTVISLKEKPYIDLQWTGAGGIVPVFLTVGFQGGGVYKELYNTQVYTDHMQVHMYDIPQGSTGVISVSLTKECSHINMDGMMRFTSSPSVFVRKVFYLQLVP